MNKQEVKKDKSDQIWSEISEIWDRADKEQNRARSRYYAASKELTLAKDAKVKAEAEFDMATKALEVAYRLIHE